MQICNSGHTEIAFDDCDNCPTCELHYSFDLGSNDEVKHSKYSKCEEHDVFVKDDNCSLCYIDENTEEFIQEHTYSCHKHGSFEPIYFYHSDECPACANLPENNLDDKQKDLEEEVERLKKRLEEQEKDKATSCDQRTSGYEFL